ncbi:MAG: ABC transporter permease [Rhodospirillaceae bacterium]|nr:ABC transporter permease [Rhodospirillaceae bacterium]
MTSRFGRIIWTLFGAATVLFMLSPLFLLVLFSFGRNELASFPMRGLTFDWYRALFAKADFWVALENSAYICLAVGVTSVLVGNLAAFAFAGLRPRRAAPALAAIAMPLMMPPLVLALALFSTYSALGFSLSIATVVPGQVVFIQPFVILVIYSRMASFDTTILDSARDLGASPIKAFLTVTLPIISPTVIGAALIAMALSLDEFIITYYTIGGGLTLPTLIWGLLRRSLDPSVNALATLILVTTVGSTILAIRATRYRG